MPAELFCFLVLLFSRKLDSHLRWVSDRVRDEVFLAASVTLLQCIHASLVQGCSCFFKHAFGAPAKTPRALQHRVTRSCFVQAELNPAGLGLGSASAALWYSVFGQRRGAGVHTACCPHRTLGMEDSLPASGAVRPGSFSFLGCQPYWGCGCGWFAGQSPGSPLNTQALHVCLLLLMLLEFAFKKSVSKLLCVVTLRE